MDSLIALLTDLGSSDKAIREPAENTITETLKNDPHDSLCMMLEVACSPNEEMVPEEISLQAALRAKLYIVHELEEKQWENHPALDRMKELLVSNIQRMSKPRRRTLFEINKTIISAMSWPGYYEHMFGEVGNAGEDPVAVAVALNGLYIFTKRMKTFGMVHAPDAINHAYQLLDALPALLNVESFEVVHQVFKIFECCIECLSMNCENYGNLEPWLDFMYAFPTKYHDVATSAGPNEYQTYVRCVKRVAVVAFGMLQDYTAKKKVPPLAKFFAENYTVQFYEMFVNWLDFCKASDDQPLHKKSVMPSMRFIKMCAFMPSAYANVVQNTAVSVIQNQLLPYLGLREEDYEAFEGDIDDFSRYMVEEEEGEYTERQVATNTIIALCSFNKKYHDSSIIQSVLGIIHESLDNQDTTIAFGMMHLLGNLRKLLKKMDDVWRGGALENVLIDKVVPHTSSEQRFLRYKGAWLIGRFSNLPISTEENFTSFIKLVLELAQDSSDAVRIGALCSLSHYISVRRAKPYIRDVLVPLVEETIALMERVTAPFLPALLNFLADNFGPELIPILEKLVHMLVKSYLATTHDLRAAEEEDIVPTDNKAISKYEVTAMSGFANLNTIHSLILTTEHFPDAAPPLMGDVLWLFKSIIEDLGNEDVLDTACNILMHQLFICGKVGATLPGEAWDIVQLIHRSLMNGAVDYFSKFEPILDNFVSSFPQQWVTNVDVKRLYFEMCEKMMIGGVVVSMDDRMGGPELIESILHHMKDFSNDFDEHFGAFARLLLEGLQHPDNHEDKVRMWMCAASCDCFWYNAEMMMNGLFDCGAYPHFFDGFFGFFREVTAPEAAAGLKKKKKKRKDKKTFGLLNRKVVVLGMVSFLNAVAVHPEWEVDPGYVSEAIDLINYCVTENAATYAARLKVYQARRAEMDAKEDESDEEYEDEDVDLIGEDGDISDATAGSLAAAIRGARTGDGTEDDVVEEDDPQCEFDDEGNDYHSPIDAVNEAGYFLEWINNAQGGNLGMFNANSHKFDEAGLSDANTVVGMHMEWCREDEEREAEAQRQRRERFENA